MCDLWVSAPECDWVILGKYNQYEVPCEGSSYGHPTRAEALDGNAVTLAPDVHASLTYLVYAPSNCDRMPTDSVSRSSFEDKYQEHLLSRGACHLVRPLQ